MPRYRRPAATVLSAATLLALISGCSNSTAQGPSEAPAATISATAPAPVTPEGTLSPTAQDTSATAQTVRLGQDDEHDITSPNTTASITCEGGGDIDIDTDGTTLTVTGDCEDIDIDGNGNTVTGETVHTISVDGTDNTATMANASDIDVDGSTNVINVDDTRDIDVDGDSNTVTYVSGDPAIENEGNNAISTR